MSGRTFLERWIEKVAISPDGCWLWTGAKDKHGYGQLRVGRRTEGQVYAHRAAWWMMRGPIPEGMSLDHLCRNPACVNPTHLEPVTQKENVLRGVGFAAVNAKKTHCERGHAFDAENTYIVPSTGHRRCRQCQRDQAKRRESL